MTKILIITLLLAFNVWSREEGVEGCNQRHTETDKSIISRCQLGTKNAAVELVKLKKYCRRIEGDILRDCYIVRTCPVDGKGSFFQAPIMLVSSMQKKGVYCHKSGKPYVLLRDEKNGIEVRSSCKENQPDKIILKINKTEKICDL